MGKDQLGRRQFIRVSAGAALTASVGCGDESGTDTAGDGSGDGSDGSVSDGSSATGASSDGGGDASTGGGSATTGGGDTATGGNSTQPACPPTDPDIVGPFYRPDIPVRGDLDLYGDPGIPLLLQGTVIDTTCTPVENAVVELWQAHPRLPDGQPGDAPEAVYDDSTEHRYYGQVATDDQGRFEFKTLRPGWYLNGAEYRSEHLHIKVWVGSEEVLNTQLYFDGDPFNDIDPWFNPDNMLVPDGNGDATYEFSISL